MWCQPGTASGLTLLPSYTSRLPSPSAFAFAQVFFLDLGIFFWPSPKPRRPCCTSGLYIQVTLVFPLPFICASLFLGLAFFSGPAWLLLCFIPIVHPGYPCIFCTLIFFCPSLKIQAWAFFWASRTVRVWVVLPGYPCRQHLSISFFGPSPVDLDLGLFF